MIQLRAWRIIRDGGGGGGRDTEQRRARSQLVSALALSIFRRNMYILLYGMRPGSNYARAIALFACAPSKLPVRVTLYEGENGWFNN